VPVFLLALLLVLTACRGPQQTAKEFAMSPQLPSILLISDPTIYTEFFRPDEIRDSLNFFKPEKIMHMMNDSVVENLKFAYNQVFVRSASEKGFQMYETDSITSFFSSNLSRWQLSLVQVTLEEHRVWFQDELNFSDYSVYFDTIISEFQYNVWFELIPVDADTSVPAHVLFSSVSVSDYINGKFTYDWGTRNYSYNYTFNPIDVYDIETMVIAAAMKHTDYLFDFFLNRHVFFNNKKSEKTKVYYSYDRRKKKVVPALDRRFVFL
jgi:hypothetical protein